MPLFLELRLLDPLQVYISEPNRAAAIVFLLLCTGFLLLLDSLRFRYRKVNRFFLRACIDILKPEERASYSSASLAYFLSFLLLLFILPVALFTLCCLFLIVADPCAAYVGSRFGRLRFANSKSLEGLLAFFLSASIAGAAYLGLRGFLYGAEDPFALFYLSTSGIHIRFPILVFLLTGAFCAAAAEFLSKKSIGWIVDDNLTVPMGGALGLVLSGFFLASYPIEALLDPFNPF